MRGDDKGKKKKAGEKIETDMIIRRIRIRIKIDIRKTWCEEIRNRRGHWKQP